MIEIYGELVRRYRVATGLTQEELAELSGLDVRTISDIERGRTARPHRSTIDLLARALGRDDLAYEAIRARRLAWAADSVPPAPEREASPPSPRGPPQLAESGSADSAITGADHGDARIRPVVDVFPVAIGHYADPDLPDLDAEARSGRLIDLLAPFGGQHRPWRHPVRGRGADAVQRRLREWSGTDAQAANPPAPPSVLYWSGHGWSDSSRCALAHAESPAMVAASGLEPRQLAQAIRARQAGAGAGASARAGDDGGWAMVILETTHAAKIADAVMAALHGADAPARLLVVAVPDGNAGPAGRFAEVLANLLADTFRVERRILLRDLAAQLERLLGAGNVHQRALGDAAIVRTYPPVASWMSAPADTIACLEDVLGDLPADERGHFIVKAQGAEHGELSWFFEGREDELTEISAWLRQASSGMFVVTGRAGSGKSALLGTLLVRSLPALRDALARRGLADLPRPDASPPESVFDAVIHLSGLGLAQAVERAARAAGTGPLPSSLHAESGVAGDLDFLAESLVERPGQFTVLADALDESLDPLDIARSLLARLAALPGVRVVAGTRASTSEAPDLPAGDENLLDALGSGSDPIDSAEKGAQGSSRLIWVGEDQAAIGRYVAGRLRAARDYGAAGRAIPHMSEVSDQDIERVAREVAATGREFLFARLATYELIADPRLLTAGLAQSRALLLQGTHQHLFERALHRLAGYHDRYPVLMQALSLARGRGLPEADGIWATIAAALDPAPGVAAHQDDSASAWATAISGLLSQAAAYISADAFAGHGGSAGQGTVYRLAHQTFAEYLGRRAQPGQDGPGSRGRAAAAALLRAAADASAGAGRLPEYLVSHLSGHVAEAGMWDDLAARPGILDHLDPNAVSADGIRTLLGRRPVPPSVAAMIGARDALAAASPADRPGLRQLATTIHSPRQVVGERVTSWGVAASLAGHSTLHVSMHGHASSVNKVLSLSLPGGRVMLASCGDDGTIRLWDPFTATPVGVPMAAHTSTIDDICVLSGRDGSTLLAGGEDDGAIRLWDASTGLPAGPVISAHAGGVLALCVLPASVPDEPSVLASAGIDGMVRLWNPESGQPAGPVITAHAGPVWGLCLVPPSGPGQAPVLASAGEDGTVRLWNPATGHPAGPVITAHAGPVLVVCAVPSAVAGHPSILASAGIDGTVRLWNPESGQPAGPVITAHAGPVWGLCLVPPSGPGQAPVLASAGEDGTVRLWNPATGQPAGPVITARQAGGVLAVCAVPSRVPGRLPILASAGSDGTVRLWDPSSQPARPVSTEPEPVLSLCVVPGRREEQRSVVASAGSDGSVRLWDPHSGKPAGPVITGHAGGVLAVCMVPDPVPGQPPVLASAGRDGTVRLWDPHSGKPAGPVIAAHAGPVRCLCVVPGRTADLAAVLASAGSDGAVRFWNPVTGKPAGPVITGHAGGVMAVCVVPGAVPGEPGVLASAGIDGTVRLWDPPSGKPAGPVITGHTGPVWGLCVIPPAGPGQPAVLASAGEDGTVRLWNPATGLPAGPVINARQAGGVLAVCVVLSRQRDYAAVLASAASDGTVRLWDTASGKLASPVMTGHTGHVRSICVLPSRDPKRSPVMASAGNDGTVRLWHAATGREIGEPLVRSAESVQALASCAGTIGDCVSMHGDGAVRCWSAAAAELTTVTAPPDVCAIATLIAAGQLSLLAGDVFGRVHLLDLRAGHHLGRPLEVSRRPVLAVCPLPAWPPPGCRAAIADSAGMIMIITISAAGQLDPGPILRCPAGPVRALCPVTCPDGRVLLAAGSDDGIWVWELAAFEANPQDARAAAVPADISLAGHDGRIWSLASVPARYGRSPSLASAGADHAVRLWDPRSGRASGGPLAGHTGQVRAVIAASSDDGRTVVVSGGHDGTVRLWDPVTGAPQALIPLGIGIHALLQQDPDAASLERTGGGATITVGLRTGILALDLHSDLFRPVPAR